MSWVTSIVQALLGSSLAGKIWDAITGQKTQHKTKEESLGEIDKINEEGEAIRKKHWDIVKGDD